MSALRTQVATLKQSLVDVQKSSASESQTLRSQVATLKQFTTDTQKQFTGLHDRVAFLEKTFWYKNILEQPYQKDTHIPGKDMARLVELKIVLGRNFNVRLFPSWDEWIANASEHELIDVTIAMMNRDDFCILHLFAGVHVSNRQDERYDYRYLLKQLPYEKFTECRVSRVENVLTKLHEMKLLK